MKKMFFKALSCVVCVVGAASVMATENTDKPIEDLGLYFDGAAHTWMRADGTVYGGGSVNTRSHEDGSTSQDSNSYTDGTTNTPSSSSYLEPAWSSESSCGSAERGYYGI